LGALRPGQFRHLTDQEVHQLQRAVAPKRRVAS